MTSSEPLRARLHAGAVATMVGAGASLLLLERAVAASNPLAATGWWAGAAAVVWLLLAPPTLATLRDAVLPGAFLALSLGLAGYALDVGEVALVAGAIVLPLALGPAISGLLRRTMPPPLHLVALAAGALAAVAVVSAGSGAEPGVVLAGGAGAALTVVHVLLARTLHRHRVVAHGGAVLGVAGALLIAGAASTGAALPIGEAWLPLSGAIALGGAALPLVRVRLAQRMTPGGFRPHLPLFAVGALAVGGVPDDLARLAAVVLAMVGAWAAGLRPSELTGVEAFRPGP